MLNFITLLRQRYQTLLSQLDHKSAHAITFQQRLEQLIFAEAFIRKGDLLDAEFKLPLQIAVIGPTQAGKSSVCNGLLNNPLAGVSALAGYTVHPQGFCAGVSLNATTALQHYFGRYQQLAPSELSANRYDCFALSENLIDAPLLPPCILWDTPDFDSIHAPDYKEGVIRTIALADIIILVLSKEKYADQSVWEMISLIEAFNQPTLICINKLPENTENIITRSLKQKWQQARTDVFPETIPLFYDKQTNRPHWQQKYDDLIYQLAKKAVKRNHFRYQSNLIRRYWSTWLAPVIAEHQAADEWQRLVSKQIDRALIGYQRDYLNHPHYYETFQQTLIELLNLLEIPGIATVLTQTRRILTWPIRSLLRLKKTTPQHGLHSKELILLNQQAEHLFIQLTEHLLDKIDTDSQKNSWWKENYRLLRQQRKQILEDFSLQVDHYHENFQQDIEATAHRLYKKLQQKPLILNSLRTTRLSVDAATIALVIKTGGIGIHDLVLTPAMLSLTSLLTETALGSYMNKTEKQLKTHQLETVKQQLFIDCLQHWLYQLPEQMTTDNHFNISPEQLAMAEKQRVEKKHGLQIL
ncbi:MAG: GTPase domain-containing protein [Methylococcales bacterium]|nr:GTPase domain-containing protein [Methylococcales bacterium]